MTCPTIPHGTAPDRQTENGASLPSYHRFRTYEGFYFYDFNTNGIVRVSQELYENMDHCLNHNGNGNGAKAGADVDLDEVRDALGKMKEQGLLLRDAQEVVAPPYCESCITKKLDSTIDMMCLELSQECNLRCRYCAYSGSYPDMRTHNPKLMSQETAFKAIDHYLSHSQGVERPVISFYGGEPMLNRKVLVACIEYARSRADAPENLKFSVDTNGTLVDDEVLDLLMENDFILQISIDGPKHLHDANRVFRNGRGSWNRVHGLLDRVYERDRVFYENNVFIACTVTPPYRFAELEEFFQGERERRLNMMVNFVDQEGVDLETLFPEAYEGDVWENYRNFFRDYQEKMCTGRREEISTVGRALFDRPIIDVLLKSNKKADGRIPCNGICVPGLRKMFVDVDGYFYPCEKVGQDFPIGHVDTGLDRRSIDQLIDDYKTLCEKHCHECWAARLCRQCFASSRRHGGMSEERKLEECKYERANQHLALASIAQIMESCPESLEFVKNVQIS